MLVMILNNVIDLEKIFTTDRFNFDSVGDLKKDSPDEIDKLEES